MKPVSNAIRQGEDSWSQTPSTPTRSVSQVGDAWVLQGAGDYDLTDLNELRRRFPDRRVTLDADMIIVWPPFTRAEPNPAHHRPVPHSGTEQGQPVRFPHPIPATSPHSPQQHQGPQPRPVTHPAQGADAAEAPEHPTEIPSIRPAAHQPTRHDTPPQHHHAHLTCTAKSQHRQPG